METSADGTRASHGTTGNKLGLSPDIVDTNWMKKKKNTPAWRALEELVIGREFISKGLEMRAWWTLATGVDLVLCLVKFVPFVMHQGRVCGVNRARIGFDSAAEAQVISLEI